MNPTPRPPLVCRSFLLLVLILGWTASAAFAVTPPFDRTTIVGGSGTDLANGTALLNAVAAAGALATPSDPYLIKVEPGIFDLGSSTLQMENFVDIEGSGRNATFIRSSASSFSVFSTVTVAAGIDAEIRNLTVQNFSSFQGAAITNFSSELKATQLNLEVATSGTGYGFRSLAGAPRISGNFYRVSSDTGDAIGMLIQDGGPIINEMFVFVFSQGGSNIGWLLEQGTNPIVEQVSAVILGSPKENVGMRLDDGAQPRVTNARLTVTGGSGIGLGIDVIGTQAFKSLGLDLKESTIDVTSGIQTAGLNLDFFARAEVQTSEIRARGTVGGAGPLALNATNSSSAFVDQSILDGKGSVILASGSSFRGGSSKLAGSVSAPAGTTAVCAFSYKGNYTPRAANCL